MLESSGKPWFTEPPDVSPLTQAGVRPARAPLLLGSAVVSLDSLVVPSTFTWVRERIEHAKTVRQTNCIFLSYFIPPLPIDHLTGVRLDTDSPLRSMEAFPLLRS
jgi:hypothetical protein